MDRMCACAPHSEFLVSFIYCYCYRMREMCDFPLWFDWSGLLCLACSNNMYNIVIFVSRFIDKPDKKNFVDSNDISIYKTKRTITTSLFTPDTRPDHINRLYETAAATPVLPICSDEIDGNDHLYPATSFGARTRRRITKKIDAEIETRIVSFHCFLS